MKQRIGIMLFLTLLAVGMSAKVRPRAKNDSTTLHRVMGYTRGMEELEDTLSTNMYVRYYFNTQKRNIALRVVPTMYAISRGGREFAGETMSSIMVSNGAMTDAHRLLDVGTIPHHTSTMPSMLRYLMPNIYGKSLLSGQLLSPFNRHNSKLYTYHLSPLGDGMEKMAFRPKHHNTQLVSGSAVVESATGRIVSVRLSGEYDMVKFHIDAQMGDSGIYSLFPKECDIDAKFRFLGNKITTSYHSVSGIPTELPDSIADPHDISLMDMARPSPLPTSVDRLYAEHYSTGMANTDSLAGRKSMRSVMGKYFIRNINGNFGAGGAGAFRLSPIINPLYLGYSKHKGVTYKIKFAGSYNFTGDLGLALDFKAGYAFKQRQFYFDVPLQLHFNKRHNGYVLLEVGSGNRISYANMVNRTNNGQTDQQNIDGNDKKDFTDLYLNIMCNYDVRRRLSLRPGLVFHRRSAVDVASFQQADLPTRYYSLAPKLEVQYRPVGSKGPVLTADYEHGVRANRADMVYERYEFDASYIRRLNRLRSVSLRVGGGFYAKRSGNSYFLDYVNFRDETIPVGWNDNWSGDFQLLRSDWYNTSPYYVRTNVTYESPLLILSRIPLVGNLMEMERIYMNTLFVDHLRPYVEYGYGFTNRFFSAGVFVATSNHSYSGIGFRIALELFHDW